MKYKLLSASIIVLLVVACKKEKDEVPTPSTTSSAPIGYSSSYPMNVAINYSMAMQTFLDVIRIVDESFQTGYYASCSTISFDSISSLDVDTITVDFGTVNCLDMLGRNRRGVIRCEYNGNYTDSLSTKYITFSNYYVNDVQVTGTISVINNGRDASGRTNYTVVTSGNVLLSSGTTVYNASNLFTQTNGATTPAFVDDVWMVSGTGTGVSNSGLSYSISITSPIVKSYSCPWVSQGIVNLVPSGYVSSSVDFGAGACDNQGTITIETNVFVYTLY